MRRRIIQYSIHYRGLPHGREGAKGVVYNVGMFIDQVEIHVKSGKGGDSMVDFRREKSASQGGQDDKDVIFGGKPTVSEFELEGQD